MSFLFLSLLAVGAAAPAAKEEFETATPADNGKALVNPSMGWTFHFYSNKIENYGSRLRPSDTLDDFPGLSVIYLRLPWSFIEREEGEFDWSIVDAPAQRWIDKGLQVAFRFSCAESWLRYATPRWVKEAGAKGYDCAVGKGVTPGGPLWEPDYGDPVFLEKLDAFLARAAARYDGNPNVAFIDVGSFGVWGEGHVFHTSQIKYPPSVVKKHIDLYAKHFKKTLLAANDDFSFQDSPDRKYEINRYAFSLGMTLRDDSILVQPPPRMYFHADMAELVWRKRPVILENEHYGSSRAKGAWGDGSWLLRAVEEYHASYTSIHWWPRVFLREQRPLIDRINRRLGYRIRLVSARWPRTVSKTEKFSIISAWSNAGVAPCYPGGYVAWTLKDEEGGVVAVFVDEDFNVRELRVGPQNRIPVRKVISRFRCALNLKPGGYRLYVSVGLRDGTPKIALPHDRSDGRRRYFLGRMRVVEGAR